MTEPRPSTQAPRELVLASAGSGKTYLLSSRIIGLLAAGAPPNEILASTFTRKAAGEILERVLERLAEALVEPDGVARLDRDARLPGAPELTRERVGELLTRLVGNLHHLHISTLDAFFHRVARIFALELGLSSGWRVANEGQSAALLAAAVERTLNRVGDAEIVELLRLLHPGQLRRGVHDQLLAAVEALQTVHRQLDPGTASPWGFEEEPPERPRREEVERIAERLGAAEVPVTKAGEPNKVWVKAVRKVADSLRAGDWEGAVSGKLVEAALGWSDDGSFNGVEPPDAIRTAVQDAALLAALALRTELHRRMQALGRLAAELEDAYREVRDQRALYRFDDVPQLLLEGAWMGGGDELYYRLDGRIRHVLLDEFQDTSILQWQALLPLLDEVFGAAPGERAGVIVADPKQSIYGWRGGEPRLLDDVASRYSLPAGSLAGSWRTGWPVLEVVNRIFGSVASSGRLGEEERAVAADWTRAFAEHTAQHVDRAGYVRVIEGPAEGHDRDLRPGLLTLAADEVEEILAAAPGASIGVLCRKGASVTRMIFELRSRGVAVSEEGGGPVTDSWGAHLLLAALRLADRPGDRVAQYMVANSPLGPVLGLGDPSDGGSADRAALEIRERLFTDGYGVVLDGWARALAPSLPPRDRARMDRLVELAFMEDAGGEAARPLEFVEAVERTRVEAPGEARVRVMTVHAAKGLEFDAVVLPTLEGALRPRGRGAQIRVAPVRSTPGGPIERVHAYPKAALRPLFPEVADAVRDAEGASFRDELSALYVSLTRARYALHLLVEEGREEKPTAAALVREGLGIGSSGGTQDPVPGARRLFESGDPDWGAHPSTELSSAREESAEPSLPEPRFPSRRRSRFLPQRTPSELEGGGVRSAASLLSASGRPGREIGTLVHAWLAGVEWLDEAAAASDPGHAASDAGPAASDPGHAARAPVPTAEELRVLAERAGVAPAAVESTQSLLRRALEHESLREVLERSRLPAGTRVHRELPFLVRDGDRLLSGSVDRVLVFPGADGRPERALVVDYKTDAVVPGEGRSVDALVEHYRPQLEAYRRAVSTRFGVPEARIDARVLFLRGGEARSV